MNISDIQNKTVQVYNYQTTFLTLKVDEQFVKLDFINKKEFNLKKGTVGPFTYFEKHPLLINYNENIVDIYINSKPDCIDSFVDDFKNAIDKITNGWRNWMSYVEVKKNNITFATFLSNVKSGSGKLSEAPFSITEKILLVCEEHNVLTKTFGSDLKTDNYKLIFIGDNYVIAKEFRNSTRLSHPTILIETP